MSSLSPVKAVFQRSVAFLQNYRWGGASLISLYISVLSGIVLALQYDQAEPFYSLSTIELIVPYGAFWRSLHYYSSQLFFLFLVMHLVVVLWKKSDDFSRSAWIRLCLSLPCAILLLFTGYVLRGDATGEAAGTIAEHISLSIPWFGETVNHLFFDLQASGVRKVYAQHLIGLMVLGGISVWPHLRRYRANVKDFLLLAMLILFLSALVQAPIEASRFGLLFIAGPWFFLGLQELLRHLPPFLASVIIPLLPVLLLCLLPRPPQQRARRVYFLLLVLWLLIYAWFSWLCLQRI